MHHFIASLAILFFKTYSAHGLVTFWKILVRARRYSTMSSSRVKCTTLHYVYTYLFILYVIMLFLNNVKKKLFNDFIVIFLLK